MKAENNSAQNAVQLERCVHLSEYMGLIVKTVTQSMSLCRVNEKWRGCTSGLHLPHRFPTNAQQHCFLPKAANSCWLFHQRNIGVECTFQFALLPCNADAHTAQGRETKNASF